MYRNAVTEMSPAGV